ncbi:MAG: gas vesicle protein GvpG [Nocardioides sp.]|nr:gas vesicle protein GvpG [Nocardioides sp.]
MGLLTSLVTLPATPVRRTFAIAEQVRRRAEEAYYDPAAIGAELDEVDARRDAGEITDEEATALEDALIERLMEGQRIREERHG